MNHLAVPTDEVFRKDLVISRTHDSHAALSFVELQDVVSDFVQQHVEEHELPQGVVRPRYRDTRGTLREHRPCFC